MAVPKQKTSRSATRKRRSAKQAPRPALVEITIDGRSGLVPPRLVPPRLVPAYRRGLLRLPE